MNHCQRNQSKWCAHTLIPFSLISFSFSTFRWSRIAKFNMIFESKVHLKQCVAFSISAFARAICRDIYNEQRTTNTDAC